MLEYPSLSELTGPIAYQGHRGAYSHLACTHVFPHRETLALGSFRAAMKAAESGEAALAMIPVENSTAGRVEEIYRLIPAMQLHIVGEHFEAVNHCLMIHPEDDPAHIRTVLSHPQALAQCSDQLLKRGYAPQATLDTAGAALEVSQRKKPGQAAIASRLAADLYGLHVVAEHFQDQRSNTTRFILLSHVEHRPDFDRALSFLTSLLFRVRNIPASLYKALGGFATNGVNLIKLESYSPGGRLSASQFHVDIAAHIDSPSMQFALEELAFFAEDVRHLGTYLAHPYRQTLIADADHGEEKLQGLAP